jgi:hypothetical protein
MPPGVSIRPAGQQIRLIRPLRAGNPGRALAIAAIEAAMGIGYAGLVLDTLPAVAGTERGTGPHASTGIHHSM